MYMPHCGQRDFFPRPVDVNKREKQLIKLTNIGKHEKRDNRQKKIGKSDNKTEPFTNQYWRTTKTTRRNEEQKKVGVTKSMAKYYR